MTAPASSPDSTPDAARRVVAAGKFFQLGDSSAPFRLRGVTYGPFAPDAPSRVEADFKHIAALGFNTVRLYEIPDQATLDAAAAHHLRLICGIPWTEHVDFLADSATWDDVRDHIRRSAKALGTHPQIAAILVGNEIEKTLVRWMGPSRVRAALEELIEIAHTAAPETLISYATYPSTEYLVPRNADFLSVNVYLENRADFARYLARLQNLAGNKPLVISEFGLDTAAHDDAAQADMLCWFHDETLRAGCAGAVWFSYTDEWFRGGSEVTSWRFGLTKQDRSERPACEVARHLPLSLAPPPTPPRISVIVCTRNGSRTLPACLDSLESLNYPDYEVLLIDDGSTDSTPEIAKARTFVRYDRQKPSGLSVARNRGAELATGSILAYTDDDCIAHPEWLLYLSHAFEEDRVLAAGGPNIPPPPRNSIERIVAAAPGAPVHVLLNDSEAEHLPGCNLAIRKDALARIEGFTDEFKTAGDDVDICWRLSEHGGRGSLRFMPGAMVWHHRRFTIRTYLKQQRGYGFAEALLMAAHPDRFGPLGGARWRGGIYGDHMPCDNPHEGSIFHGPLGLGAFQTIYAPNSGFRWWDWFTGVLWIACAALALVLKSPLVATAFLAFALWASWRISSRNAHASSLRGTANRSLLWLLSFLQPIIREFARLRGMILYTARPTWQPALPDILPPLKPRKISTEVAEFALWSDSNADRHAFLAALRAELARRRRIYREDDGWRWFDLELSPQNDLSSSLLTVTEYHGHGRCLTRVRAMLRVRRGLVWNLLLWIAFAGLLATLPMPLGLLGIIGVSITLTLVPAAIYFTRRELISLTQTAAQRAGLVVIQLGDNPPAVSVSPAAMPPPKGPRE